ncbi:MAG: bifunctional folylpolyglutamate synthase/dihydrofolate synthase [Proteobacteria bacterium]|nr:bifunctional folylpolyglutamate synthase/dihydrofolate synthase [Pseudomonadota bacterium]MBU1736726.1 bifunctional folylpolyglutamate synthase/dihydrofolate synthase [Pseudomonadota bacterium]
MNYPEAWSFLDNLQFFKIKLGLDSMRAFLKSVGDPQREMKFVHVAGTNGKGSVSANLLTMLSAAGYRTGLYTSPHLTSVRERFRINDAYISEEEFARHASRIRSVLDGKQITYFEFTTALALLWFAERRVDLVILEVGLGGRLDATNVVEPLVGVITNVSMDHEAYLGNTLQEVASEKAGIIKKGVPVVSGVAEDISREVVVETCRAKGAVLYLLGRDFSYLETGNGVWSYHGLNEGRSFSGLPRGLAGGYQTGNSALALAVIDILGDKGFNVPEETIRSSIGKVSWPGRLESFCLTEPLLEKIDCRDVGADPLLFRRYLLDGAHNPAGIEGLAEYLEHLPGKPRLIMVWASMSDKDYGSALRRIALLVDRLIFCRPEEERSATPEELTRALPDAQRGKAVGAESVARALEVARNLATGEDLICVAGSLYLVGAARGLLLGELV